MSVGEALALSFFSYQMGWWGSFFFNRWRDQRVRQFNEIEPQPK